MAALITTSIDKGDIQNSSELLHLFAIKPTVCPVVNSSQSTQVDVKGVVTQTHRKLITEQRQQVTTNLLTFLMPTAMSAAEEKLK